ncbi:MAG: carbohydrate kinase family protein [Kiritimatiellaceae bacterium]|nr:carbohydrate kinase family protein [Kiritimatiellaceae bacterium]
MKKNEVDVIVAGHLCLDIIPAFPAEKRPLSDLHAPGRLTNVGGAVCATGGAVSNTGLALHRYGLNTRLVGKIGNDTFGRAILDVIRARDPGLTQSIVVAPGEASSYTIVINPPGIDRMFLHCPGANDAFCADDVDFPMIGTGRLFHFGYPPLMRRMFLDCGAETAKLFCNAKANGLTTSLDMARPDSGAESGRVDWRALLRNILPHVDIFLPSVDELLYMLDRPRFAKFEAALEAGEPLGGLRQTDLRALSDELIAMGTGMVVMKLGAYGLYLRSSANSARLLKFGNGAPANPAQWIDRELYHPCFEKQVVGTTGAGDCAIAGFLAGLLYGQNPEAVMDSATGSGACNVEAADAISGIPTWDALQKRISKGWKTEPGL